MPELPKELLRIEQYYDAVPRAAARVEPWPPLTLFVAQGAAWPYYARPALGSDARTAFQRDHVDRVRERQRALRVPEAFEWVHEVTPGLWAAAEAAGLSVREHPLMLLDVASRWRPPVLAGVTVRLVPADEPDAELARLGAVATVGFRAAGTAVGAPGVEALTAATPGASGTSGTSADQLRFRRERLRAGLTVVAEASTAEGPVSTGSHQPVGGITEIVGVATLPAYRRRGIGAAVVDLLVEDALSRGIRTVFLSAGDDAVARVYERLGFRRIATACIAEAER